MTPANPQAEPLIDYARRVGSAFSEAVEVLNGSSKTDADAGEFVREATIRGLEMLGLLARKLAGTREMREAATTTPILSDPRLRVALTSSADTLDALKPVAGMGAARGSATLRRLVERPSPALLAQLEAIVESAARVAKKRRQVAA